MVAAERGIWKSTELRRQLADAGLEISAGKMSALWTGTPTTIRLDDLDVLCSVLDCAPSDLLIRQPEQVAARSRRCERRTTPRRCTRCGDRPVAFSAPRRTDFCYDCMPGGSFTPPSCRRCGSSDRYFSAGWCCCCPPQ